MIKALNLKPLDDIKHNLAQKVGAASDGACGNDGCCNSQPVGCSCHFTG